MNLLLFYLLGVVIIYIIGSRVKISEDNKKLFWGKGFDTWGDFFLCFFISLLSWAAVVGTLIIIINIVIYPRIKNSKPPRWL